MNLQKICLAALFCILALTVCFGQNTPETVEGDNWVAQSGIYPTPLITFRYDRYSREDTIKFREKFDLLKNAKSGDEWSGVYYVGYEETVNHSELRLDSNIGFIEFNVYTCLPELRHIDFGKIVNTADFLQLSSEFTPNSPRKSEPVKYVKVKWGDKYLLVEESSLSAFAEKAVGIYVEPEEDKYTWTDFWVKGDLDSENHLQVQNEYSGLPEFPASYKKFQRLPIETKIVAVGKRAVDEPDGSGQAIQTEYTLTIGAGKDKGVKVGMKFEISGIEGLLEITEVNSKNAVGVITRSVDENKNDLCLGDADVNYSPIPCPKIKKDLKVKTEIGKFWF